MQRVVKDYVIWECLECGYECAKTAEHKMYSCPACGCRGRMVVVGKGNK